MGTYMNKKDKVFVFRCKSCFKEGMARGDEKKAEWAKAHKHPECYRRTRGVIISSGV